MTGARLLALHRLAATGDADAAARWRAAVRAALEAARSVPAAAAALGVGRRTLEAWLRATPGLRDGLPLPRAGNPAWLPQPTAAEATGEWDGDERA